jgi:Clustered mitochondria
MFIRPPWNVATPGTFSTPEKNISNEEKSLKFLKNKKVEDNKKTSAELSRLADRINSNKSVVNDSARSSKSDVIVPQYSSHNFDLSRLHDDLCDQFGAEDPGAPREWLVPFLPSLPFIPSSMRPLSLSSLPSMHLFLLFFFFYHTSFLHFLKLTFFIFSLPHLVSLLFLLTFLSPLTYFLPSFFYLKMIYHRNEEMQSVRTFKSDNISEKVMKAKYIHNIYQEFRDAVKTGALAISDGHIAPMNPLDPEKAHVYVYNNIFYSQAVESKESFKICDGDDASRKLAGHDLKNQRMIQSLDVEGLCTVLSCIVDFKGARLIGQTIIPGVLQVGVHSARLLYGAIERGKRLTVKNEGLKIMNSLFSELFMVERKIQATPHFTVYPTGDEDEDTVATVPIKMDYFGLGEEENQATSVEIDFEDDVVDATSEIVPHIGCLEIKLLKGTDGRAYVLDAMRLTPIDANYVKGPKGTGNFPPETLSLINNNVSTAYVLRHELISSYSQHKAALQRQDVIRKELQIHREKMIKKEAENENKMKEMLAECDKNIIKDSTSEKDGHKEMKGIELPAAVTAVAAAIAVTENDKDVSSVSAQKQNDNKNENENVIESKTENESKDGETKEDKVAVKKMNKGKEVNGDKEDCNDEKEDEVEEEEEEEEDLIGKFDELTKQSMADTLQLNANCFIDGFECDADPVTALKDEESSRDLAHYLFKQVTVSLTEQVRENT